MSLDDCDVVAEAKSPFSTSATDTPRRARSRATPAPAMPPPMMTTSYSASSSGQGRVFIESGGPSKTVEFRRGGHGQPRRAPSITLVATRRATGAPAPRPPPPGTRTPFPRAPPPAAPSHDLGSAEEVAD